VFGCTPHNVVAIEGDDGEEEGLIFDSVDDPGPIEIIEDPPEIVEPEPEPQPDPEPVIDPNVELSKKYFSVSEDYAKGYGGLYIKHDEQLYAVVDQVPEQNYYDTGIGFHHEKDKAGGIGLWADDSHDSYVIHGLNVYFPIYEEGDSAILYTLEDYHPESLTFVPIEQKGCTISIYNYKNNDYMLCVLKDWDNLISGRVWFTNDYEICDAEGNIVENIRDLQEEKEYTVKTAEEDIALEAKCKYYEVDEDGAIEIAGVDQGDGSFEYDLDALPSGDYYVLESFGFMTIK
jgi:hypothetical protein